MAVKFERKMEDKVMKLERFGLNGFEFKRKEIRVDERGRSVLETDFIGPAHASPFSHLVPRRRGVKCS